VALMLGMPRLPRPTVADRGVVVLVAVLSAFIVLGSVGSATWLRQSADDMAAEVFDGAPHPARQVQVFYNEVADDQVPTEAGATLEQSLAPSLRAVLGPPRHTVTTTEAIMEALPKQPRYSPSYLSVVGIPDARSLVDVVEGSFPRPGVDTEVLPGDLARTYDGPREVAVVEVALERRAAEALQTPVGTYLDLVPLRYSGGRALERTLLRVSGVYEAAVPYPSPLDDVDNVRRPAISTLPEFTLVRAAGLAADDETVLQAGWMANPEIRWTFDPDRTPTADQAEAVVDDSRRLAVQPWPPVVTSGASTAATGLGELGSAYVAERDASNTSAALMLAALGAAALALLLAAASVLETRRREVTDVLRARGASTLRLLGIRFWEAALVAAPGVLVAGLLAWFTPVRSTDLVPAAIAALACAVLLATAQATPWRLLPERVRMPARDALQIVVVVLAVGLAVLLAGRDRLEGTDPLLLLLPALVGVASAVLVVRGVRLLATVLGPQVGRSSRLAPLVGAAQSGATAERVMLPVAAMVLAGCSAVLAVSVHDTVHRGADGAAREVVGADALVTGGQFDTPTAHRLEQLPGVAAVAGVHELEAFVRARVGREKVTVLAVDGASFEAATADAPVRVPEPVPGRLDVLASADLDLEGEGTTLSYAQSDIGVTVADRVESLPGLDPGGPFVLVDVAGFRAETDRRLPRAQSLLVAGDPDEAELRGAVREAWPSARVRTRSEVASQVLDQPVASRALLVSAGSLVASVLVALLGAGLAVVLGRPLRRRTLALLHALGAGARQTRWVSAVELVPALAAAGVAALGSALVLLAVATRGVDLAAVTGSATPLRLGLDAMSWLAAAAVAVALVVLVAAVAGRRPRRADLSPAHEGGTR
jgi:putative ABC transport system permease protein